MRTILLYLLCATVLTGCLEDRCTDTITYIGYEPVILSAGSWRNDTFPVSEGTTFCDPAAFYVYGKLLFVLDRNAGLHVIDNSDNSAPRPLKFLDIPGGVGMAVRNNILYVNQYVDLLTFDLSDPENPEFLHRTENVFDLNTDFAAGIFGRGDVIIDYIETDQTMEVDCNTRGVEQEFIVFNDLVFLSNASDFRATSSGFAAATGTSEQVGTGGSLARFTINRGTLYAVDDHSLRTFSLDRPAEPEFRSRVEMNWGIETIFPYEDKLFIGANNGMHIYGLEDPLQPEHLSTVEHVLSCDPVVVQNDLAYVTMWGGSDCGNQGDQLLVIDVKNPRAPKEIQTVPMTNSHGLGVAGDRLFLCSGPEGLKVFDLTDDGLLGEELSATRDFPAKDVIVLPNQERLIVLGWEQAGIRQYDYDASGTPTLAGELQICQ